MSAKEVTAENLELMGALSLELAAMAEELKETGTVTMKLDGNTLGIVKGKKDKKEEKDKKDKKEKKAKAFEPDDLEEYDKGVKAALKAEDISKVKEWAEENDLDYTEASSDKVTCKRIRKAAIASDDLKDFEEE